MSEDHWGYLECLYKPARQLELMETYSQTLEAYSQTTCIELGHDLAASAAVLDLA